MRITIYGSRPASVAVDGDIVYFINGSIQDRYRFSPTARVVHVIANRGFQEGLTEKTINQAATYVIDGFRDAVAEETILVGLGEFEPTVYALEKINYRTNKFVYYPIRDRDAVIRKVAHVSIPTGIRFSFLWGFKRALKSLKKLTESIYNRFKNWTNEFDWYIMYRPSNGVFALLHAIYTYGPDNEYILSGVGLHAWNYGYRNPKGELLVRRKKRPHLFGDYSILRAIAKYNIWTDDRFLSERTGIRFLGDHNDLRRVY